MDYSKIRALLFASEIFAIALGIVSGKLIFTRS